ncbi:MAG: MFS transporter [Stackebrandtia sp.]
MTALAQAARGTGVLPPTGPARTLALAQLVAAIGDGAFYVTSALFFTRVVGLSAAEVGAGLTLGWAVGTLAGVPLGHLADRRGPREIAILLAAVTAVAVAGFGFARSLPVFLVVICLYTCSQCGLLAARQALLAGVVAEAERTRVRAHLQSTLNAGIAVGAAMGGVALYFDTPTAYLTALALDSAAFAVSALVLRRVPTVDAAPRTVHRPRLEVLRDRRYVLLAVLNAVLLLNMPLLSLIIPLWIVEQTAAPRWTAAVILVLNTLGVVVFQVRLSRGVTGLATAARQIRRCGVLLLAACAVYALSADVSAWASVAVLAVAALLQVFGEMLLAPGAWEASFALAPSGRHGQYQGFFGAGVSVARMLGPIALTTLILGWGSPGWLVLGGTFLVVSLIMAAIVRGK